MLELKNIYKTFNPGTINEKVALNGLNLTLNEGDFVTVIGGNGAGKSTMLNAVAGTWMVDEGHIIIDFSLFDAWRAGFRDVVFIIKREMEAEFRECFGDRMERYFQVSYVFQELERLPEGISVPAGRAKPWGTGHALAC